MIVPFKFLLVSLMIALSLHATEILIINNTRPTEIRQNVLGWVKGCKSLAYAFAAGIGIIEVIFLLVDLTYDIFLLIDLAYDVKKIYENHLLAILAWSSVAIPFGLAITLGINVIVREGLSDEDKNLNSSIVVTLCLLLMAVIDFYTFVFKIYT